MSDAIAGQPSATVDGVALEDRPYIHGSCSLRGMPFATPTRRRDSAASHGNRARVYIQSNDFGPEWDPVKANINVRKHGVDFADAATVLHDSLALTVLDDSAEEERHATIGCDALGRILVVLYTWRGSRVRLISARRATRNERRAYEDGR